MPTSSHPAQARRELEVLPRRRRIEGWLWQKITAAAAHATDERAKDVARVHLRPVSEPRARQNSASMLWRTSSATAGNSSMRRGARRERKYVHTSDALASRWPRSGRAAATRGPSSSAARTTAARTGPTPAFTRRSSSVGSARPASPPQARRTASPTSITHPPRVPDPKTRRGARRPRGARAPTAARRSRGRASGDRVAITLMPLLVATRLPWRGS